MSMDDTWIKIALAGGAVAFVIGGLVYGSARSRKRGQALRAVAEAWGFDYEANGRERIRAVFAECPLMQGGRGNAAQHLLTGPYLDFNCYVFDWATAGGWDRAGEVRKQTCAGIASDDGIGIPPFVLYAGRTQPKRMNIEGLKTVSLPEVTECTDRYWLQTNDAEVLLPRLGEDLGRLLQGAYPLHVECTGKVLLAYQPNEITAAEDYNAMRTRLQQLWSGLSGEV